MPCPQGITSTILAQCYSVRAKPGSSILNSTIPLPLHPCCLGSHTLPWMRVCTARTHFRCRFWFVNRPGAFISDSAGLIVFVFFFLFSRIRYWVGWDFMSATIRLIITTNGIWIVMDGYIQDWDMWCYVMNLLFLLWHNGLTSVLGTSCDQSMPSYQTPDHYSILLLRTSCVVFL